MQLLSVTHTQDPGDRRRGDAAGCCGQSLLCLLPPPALRRRGALGRRRRCSPARRSSRVPGSPLIPGPSKHACGPEPPWWADCRTSYTCKSNWHGSWTWSRGKHRCPKKALCHPFLHYFPTPADLCEKIWSNSFKASPEHRNSGRCLQKWFEPTRGNPNTAVARLFTSPAPSCELSYTLGAFSLFLSLLS
nr:LOW QUALITY PROTEIN: sperm-egg fusion protein Juno-like [Vicugna pacos]